MIELFGEKHVNFTALKIIEDEDTP